MTKEEIELAKQNAVLAMVSTTRTNGQHTNGPNVSTWMLYSNDYKFEVKCGAFRSSIQNREMCLTLFELFLSEL